MEHLSAALGHPLPDWKPASLPHAQVLQGLRVRLERLRPADHGDALWAAFAGHPELWTYLPTGPFESRADFDPWLGSCAASSDPHFYAIVDRASGRAVGVASYLRMDPGNGCIEIGHLTFSPALQRRPQATEALSLLLGQAFQLGYRRVEWKCNALNAPSRAAAQRLGFGFEGLWRQAAVVKGRNRDTAWYAILDREWPALSLAHAQWLDPANFDHDGIQLTSLSTATRPLLSAIG